MMATKQVRRKKSKKKKTQKRLIIPTCNPVTLSPYHTLYPPDGRSYSSECEQILEENLLWIEEEIKIFRNLDYLGLVYFSEKDED